MSLVENLNRLETVTRWISIGREDSLLEGVWNIVKDNDTYFNKLIGSGVVQKVTTHMAVPDHSGSKRELIDVYSTTKPVQKLKEIFLINAMLK